MGGYRGFNGGLRGRKVGSYRPMSEINVTPMVDVMLVLLVVFMITAPLLTVGVPVDLPKTEASVIIGEDEPLVCTPSEAIDVFQRSGADALAMGPFLVTRDGAVGSPR